MRRAWIAVACAEHVRRGREGGFLQVCHGKPGPLRRIAPGDGVACYSPSVGFGRGQPYRTLTAAGIVAEGEPFPFDMGGGFRPWRRRVDWQALAGVPIAPLLPRLGFAAGRRNWGRALRFGLLAIAPEDFALILGAMAAGLATGDGHGTLAPCRENSA
jgi:hypothetical protein